MTATAPTAGAASARATLRRALPFIALAVGILLVGLVGQSGRNDGEPLDPRSTGPLGARGLVLLLERFGADVRIGGGLPPTGGTAVLLQDRLNEDETADLEEWVDGGGTLVVADPLSGFAPALGRGSTGLFEPEPRDADDEDGADGDLLRPQCPLPAVARVGAIDVEGGAGYRVVPGAIGCFPGPGGPFLVARAAGAGTIVALAGGGPLVNVHLDEADNAVLAVSVIAPRPGTVVTIVEPSLLGGGARSLSDLVSRRVKDALWQLLIAFGLFALWKARRLGRPIEEPQPVQIAGSELVVAVGNLLQQGRRREAAARMMRSSLRRTMSERLGVPADAAPDALASAAAARAGLDPAVVAAALDDRPPADDAALVALAQSVESIRKEVTHAR